MTSPRVLPESEADWERVVVDLAAFRGWRRYHPFLSVRSAHGFPDETLVRPPRVVFAELKSERGRLTVAQREWLGLLADCPGVEVYVWRPSDWPDVQRILA